ncbi:Uncharacterised protein [Bacillus licheniformis]|nr:Uncharacterised protein [Bacillus licheniformis]
MREQKFGNENKRRRTEHQERSERFNNPENRISEHVRPHHEHH